MPIDDPSAPSPDTIQKQVRELLKDVMPSIGMLSVYAGASEESGKLAPSVYGPTLPIPASRIPWSRKPEGRESVADFMTRVVEKAGSERVRINPELLESNTVLRVVVPMLIAEGSAEGAPHAQYYARASLPLETPTSAASLFAVTTTTQEATQNLSGTYDFIRRSYRRSAGNIFCSVLADKITETDEADKKKSKVVFDAVSIDAAVLSALEKAGSHKIVESLMASGACVVQGLYYAPELPKIIADEAKAAAERAAARIAADSEAMKESARTGALQLAAFEDFYRANPNARQVWCDTSVPSARPSGSLTMPKLSGVSAGASAASVTMAGSVTSQSLGVRPVEYLHILGAATVSLVVPIVFTKELLAELTAEQIVAVMTNKAQEVTAYLKTQLGLDATASAEVPVLSPEDALSLAKANYDEAVAANAKINTALTAALNPEVGHAPAVGAFGGGGSVASSAPAPAPAPA